MIKIGDRSAAEGLLASGRTLIAVTPYGRAAVARHVDEYTVKDLQYRCRLAARDFEELYGSAVFYLAEGREDAFIDDRIDDEGYYRWKQ